jgi:hypothetical protein
LPVAREFVVGQFVSLRNQIFIRIFVRLSEQIRKNHHRISRFKARPLE